jgi:branched-chain amino acid transport system substrate-binding protein
MLCVLVCSLAFAFQPPAGTTPSSPAPADQESSDQKAANEKADAKKAADARREVLYGNTPEELKPFGKFVQEPYKKYFVIGDAPVMFWGPGREKPPVEDVPTVKIGVIAPIERSYETYIGRSVVRGMKLAIDEANAAGGYRGKPFEQVIKNDSGLWGASANEIVSLTYEDKVWAVIGTVDGANTHIAIRVALRTDIPIVNVADLDPTLVETKIPWVIRVIPDDRQMTYTIAYYVYKQLGLERVAILRANNRYGRFGVTQFRKGSVKLGKPAPIEINYEPNYDKVNPDFTEQIDRLEKVNPDAVVLWADAGAAGVLVKKIREAGMKFPILACERIVHPEFLKAAGKAAEGVIATYPFDPNSKNPRYLDFVKRYRERFGEDPDVYAVHSYDGTMMLVEAIRKAGLNRYLIRDQLASMREYEGISGEILLDEALSNRRPVTVATVKNGKFVFDTPHLDNVF